MKAIAIMPADRHTSKQSIRSKRNSVASSIGLERKRSSVTSATGGNGSSVDSVGVLEATMNKEVEYENDEISAVLAFTMGGGLRDGGREGEYEMATLKHHNSHYLDDMPIDQCWPVGVAGLGGDMTVNGEEEDSRLSNIRESVSEE